MMERVKC